MDKRVNAVHFYPDHILFCWFYGQPLDYKQARIKRGGKAEANVIKFINRSNFRVNVGTNKVAFFPIGKYETQRLTNYQLDKKLESEDAD